MTSISIEIVDNGFTVETEESTRVFMDTQATLTAVAEFLGTGGAAPRPEKKEKTRSAKMVEEIIEIVVALTGKPDEEVRGIIQSAYTDILKTVKAGLDILPMLLKGKGIAPSPGNGFDFADIESIFSSGFGSFGSAPRQPADGEPKLHIDPRDVDQAPSSASPA